MDWEDCVVDVHSVKLSKLALESIFSKCGTVRSITHWKGQGEKPHVFFEYKAPRSAEAARLIGLERSDLQVIKISNNDMLKKKFRDVAHGPIRDYPSSRSFSSYTNAVKEHRLPVKPALISHHTGERGIDIKYEDDAAHRRVRSNSRDPRLSAAPPPLSRRRDSQSLQPRPSHTQSMISISPPFPSTFSRGQTERESCFSSCTDGRVLRWDDRNKKAGHIRTSPSARNIPLTPPLSSSSRDTGRKSKRESPLTFMEIPHAGEVIKFDLEKQLDPSGIIHILSAVKADQKLWMIAAAHYNGKQNLEAARQILVAGINMAAQVGEAADTKPFWHLLGQINGSLQAKSCSSVSIPSPTASSFSSSMNPSVSGMSHSGQSIENSFSEKDKLCIPLASTAPAPSTSPSSSERQAGDAPIGDLNFNSQCASSDLLPTSPILPLDTAADTSPQLQILKNEINALREKQKVILEDLSFVRAAKRRVEDEAKEERSIRRKLEKHIRTTEDALTRSKRMEDAALEQVKREVEARRKAEGLLADMKVKQESTNVVSNSGNGGLFPHPNAASEAALLLQLASIIRGVSSGDHPALLQFGHGGTSCGAASNTSQT